ncbi:hypothetical protein A2U01_0076438, partial [Trifolium medium]|nr:hypothetical protein [Trifolium medium]
TAAKSMPVGCSLAALHTLAGGRQAECSILSFLFQRSDLIVWRLHKSWTDGAVVHLRE